jgi:4-diphosphocytidyl-2-C-methyl-D-erythritol kinase
MSLLAIHNVAAPAKLNLFLHIVGRRTDGYHLLQSLFVLIDWCDTLHFELRRDGALARHDLGTVLPADDLCLRAARVLQTQSGCPLGVDISLDKCIPSGAGMGGGSSDAAATLLALNRLWGLNWPVSRLMPLGLKLGADVPFFLHGCGAALVEGVGECVTPLRLPSQQLAVVKPAASIETRAVFASPLLLNKVNPDIVTGFVESGICGVNDKISRKSNLNFDDLSFGQNDLQEAAEAECLQVKQAAALLAKQYGNSRMTGSGSAVFARMGVGIKPTATWACDLELGWTGKMCSSLAAHPLNNWAHEFEV